MSEEAKTNAADASTAGQDNTTSAQNGASREERLAVRPGMIIRVHQRITDVSPDGKERERIQVFEGAVLGRHGGSEAGATITVRKVSEGVGVERIFPIFLPTIEKIEIVKRGRVRRAKVFHLRDPKHVRTLKEVRA